MAVPPLFPSTPVHHINDDSDAIPRFKGSQQARSIWTSKEHERFLEALKMHPQGPWRVITNHIGSRSIHEVQVHAQNYQHKLARRLRVMSKEKNPNRRRRRRLFRDMLALRVVNVLLGLLPLDSAPSRPSLASFSIRQMDPVLGHPKVASSLSLSPSSGYVIESNNLPSLDESLDFFIETFPF